jgi:hypothetical protein
MARSKELAERLYFQNARRLTGIVFPGHFSVKNLLGG